MRNNCSDVLVICHIHPETPSTQFPLFINVHDATPIPDITYVPLLSAIGQEARPKHRSAFAALVADALINYPVSASFAQLAGQVLSCRVTCRVVISRMTVLEAADVMKLCFKIDRIGPHIEFLCRFVSCQHKHRSMMAGFGNGRFQGERGIENPVAAIREPAAQGVEMSERGHDHRGTWSGNAVFGRHQLQISYLLAEAIIGDGLDFKDGLKVGRIGDFFE